MWLQRMMGYIVWLGCIVRYLPQCFMGYGESWPCSCSHGSMWETWSSDRSRTAYRKHHVYSETMRDGWTPSSTDLMTICLTTFYPLLADASPKSDKKHIWKHKDLLSPASRFLEKSDLSGLLRAVLYQTEERIKKENFHSLIIQAKTWYC